MEDDSCKDCEELVMHSFIGVKIIKAAIMRRDIAEKDFGVVCGGDRNGAGYLVEYDNGYKSWSPKDVFEEAYRKTSNLSFGLATEAMLKGHSVERVGWNGGGMSLRVQTPDEHSKMTHPYYYMTVPGCHESTRLLPWQPAQVDCFANDWCII